MNKITKMLLGTLVLFTLVGCQPEQKKETKSPISEVPSEPVVSPVTPETLTVKGEAITVSGNDFLKVGDKLATDAILTLPTATFDSMKTQTLNDYSGWKVITTVPSLDTPTCAIQTSDIDSAAADYKDVNFLTISADLPFAQYRYCGANDIENVVVLSDFKTLDFARDNHLLMNDYSLLARTIMVVDENNIVQYIEYAAEVNNPVSITDAIHFLMQNK
ncbi:MAG: thiol peroxidase [Erysipelothrix sp.]